MNHTDLFRKQSAEYAAFRPDYPNALFDHLASLSPSRDLAWHCATGTGQAARGLASRFASVFATDVSAEQIARASGPANVIFEVSKAECVTLADASVDLVTVAQAIHWFDLDKFFAEVRRVLKPGGIISYWGYGFFKISPAVDAVLDPFSAEFLGPYWTDRNRVLTSGYRDLPFPFSSVLNPSVHLDVEWDLSQVKGYMRSWSAHQKYLDQHGSDPIAVIEKELDAAWGDSAIKRIVSWELYWRTGKNT